MGTEDGIVRYKLKRLRHLHIVIRTGKPFYLPQLTRKKRDEMLEKGTEEIMYRTGTLLPEKYRGVYAAHHGLQALQLNMVLN